MTAHVAILGGTAEAVALATALAACPGLRVTTSLAGVTEAPVLPPGGLRRGGFGGAGGLADWLRAEAVDVLVDATHPFAATMAAHAAEAAAAAGVPRLRLLRPMWTRQPGDRWIEVADAAAAAAAVGGLGARRVLLSLGRRELEAFATLPEVAFVVRMIESPETPLRLARAELVLARGPFHEADERALMTTRRIEAVVSKASGGTATEGKIAAARTLGLPVVLIRRPPAPPGEVVADVGAAAAWISGRLPV